MCFWRCSFARSSFPVLCAAALLVPFDSVSSVSWASPPRNDSAATPPTSMVISSSGPQLGKKAHMSMRSEHEHRYLSSMRRDTRSEHTVETGPGNHEMLEESKSSGDQDYWCSEPVNGEENDDTIIGEGKKMAKKNGYCYYLSRVGESCTETCMRQIGGFCNAAGTEYAAKDLNTCQSTLKAFADGVTTGIGYTSNSGTSQNDRTGCTYLDLPEGASRVELFKKDDLYPLCSTPHRTSSSHRVCACTVMFGKFQPYINSTGMCANGGFVNTPRWKKILANELECQDECTRNTTCRSYAFVSPWDMHPRQCIFYSDSSGGDGLNRNVVCQVKEKYLTTLGECKELSGATSQVLGREPFSEEFNNVQKCKDECDRRYECEAVQAPRDFEANGGQCVFFKKGHMGNGKDPKFRCYTQAVGGV